MKNGDILGTLRTFEDGELEGGWKGVRVGFASKGYGLWTMIGR